MKTLLKTIAAVVLAVSAISCDKDTVDSHLSAETYNATTTFKPYPDGTYYVWVKDTAGNSIDSKPLLLNAYVPILSKLDGNELVFNELQSSKQLTSIF